ncbi:hypothetical protein [Halosimplex pelagicum]|uniref:Uncharacterized protein n=1 Tax=Halosimplex pelagicum TaxID=869886 RepID=A0A7D5PF39_9EURY|nr:hypothetical protein [Halosimplex pelagicum]QLH82319.1 hypothetical protein HZS54_12150 [Halosimplex pelagicum]
MDSDILQTIKDAGEKPAHQLQRQHRIGQVRPDEDFDTALEEVQHHLLEILKLTGTEIFDDEAQWHTYQNVIAALLLTDREQGDDESRSLKEHGIEKVAPGNYNPLGELDELDDPTVEQLADRYKAEEVIDGDWQENPSMSLQQALGGALLNLTMGRFPAQRTVELHLVRAMIFVDKHYTVETILEVNEVTRSYTGRHGEDVEYDTEEMAFKQRRDIDPGIFNNV